MTDLSGLTEEERQAISAFRTIFNGRTRYEGQPLRIDEILVRAVERLSAERAQLEDPKLEQNVRVGALVLRAGVRISTLILAATRAFEQGQISNSPFIEQSVIGCGVEAYGTPEHSALKGETK